MRQIAEPLPSLKEIQHWILEEILNIIPISKYAKAYVKGKSIKDNARFHRGQKVVVKLDIKNFFGSINLFKVQELFRNLGYVDEVAVMLANLCCLDKVLPQGAPTSAALSNIIMYEIDEAISEYTNEHKIRYTRYADDMTFSGDFNTTDLIKFVCGIIKENGFVINKKKTKVLYGYKRQIVTGVVTNEKLQVPREKRRYIRQQMYYINKYGLNSHMERIRQNNPYYIEHLLGIANYILFINPKDLEVEGYRNILNEYIKIKRSL